MIEVKGTKAEAQETDASQRYVLKSMDKKSYMPIALGVFLTGLALYLKSFFPGQANSEERKPVAEDDGDVGATGPRLAQAQPLAVPSDPAAETETGSLPASKGRTDSEGMPEEALPFAQFALVESPAFDFRQPETPSSRGGMMPSPSLERPANDNRGGGGPTPDSHGATGGDPGGDDPPDEDDGSGDGGSGDGGDTDALAPCGTPDCDDDPCDGDNDDRSPAGNRAPRVSGPVYLMDVAGCATLAIGLTDLLRNAHDPDGDTLSVKNVSASSGTLALSQEGWNFQGSPHHLGPVTVTYQITDGEFTVDQVAYFSVVKQPLIAGTDGDDMLLGSMCADGIDGADGNDNIDGRAGDDVISGGKGDDHIVAGDGDDVVFGGDGDDIVFGGAGNDHLSGGEGNDGLFGESGDDVIHGGGGNDTIDGGAGDDLLFDGDGEDVVMGGGGNDHVVAALDNGDDAFDGGEGCDTLDYSGATEGLLVDLANGVASGLEIGKDCITGFETVLGGQGDDHFVVGDEAVVLAGGGGENTFEFSAPYQSVQTSPVLHEILDFQVGDRIRMSRYHIFEEAFDEMEDRFGDIYGDDADDDDVAIRYRHDRVDEMNRTIIEADFSNDDIWETTITLQGHHVLVMVESA